MTIREITRAERGQLLALYRDLHEADAPPPPPDAVEAVWSRIEADPNLFCFGVFEGDALVSTCTLAVVPNLTRGCRPFGVIENVVTRADRRRCGCGRAVLRHALARAWDRGCYKVMLMTGRRNEATYRFYESAGFDRHAKQAFVALPEGGQ
jgi:GNAT superfamily N-acetyltransferase